MNYIETGKDASGNAVKIHYNDYGKGKPIILIHGWPLNAKMQAEVQIRIKSWSN
jgi:peroxiredoxin